MKKRKIAKMALAVLSVLTVGTFGASVAGCGDDHVHSWGDWTITSTPTMTDGGSAEHKCVDNDGGSESKNIPALSDTSVWTEDTSKAQQPTHTEKGSKTYTSEYGSVTVDVPANTDAHTYGGWTITVDPTATAGGKAKHVCTGSDKFEQVVDIPALSDTAVWTEDTSKAKQPTHAEKGSKTYTSVYGSVTVDVPALTEHTYGSWTITLDPTATAGGKAKHVCTADSHEEEIDIPALSDTAVWTEDAANSQQPTHTAAGKKVYTSVYGSVTVTLPAAADAHSYGDWAFVSGKTPTLTAAGEAQRVCAENTAHVDKKEIPALSDTEFWTKTVKTAATHQSGGLDTYTNAAHKLTVDDVPSAKLAHTFGAWSITTDPTDTATGVATRTCTESGCASDATATETFTLPVLTDTTFWTCTEVQPDYTHAGSKVYTNAVYGTVTVETSAKIPLPYNGKTYKSVDIYIHTDGSAKIGDSWNAAELKVGNDGVGYGTAFPFRGKFVFELVDGDTGLVKVTEYDIKTSDDDSTPDVDETTYEETGKTLYAYFEKESGILVMQREGWSSVFFAVPDGAEVKAADFAASAGTQELLIAYNDGTNVKNVLVTQDAVVFGVEMKSLTGATLTAAEAFNRATYTRQGFAGFTVYKGGNKIAGYTFDDARADKTDKWIAADGKEGAYKSADGVTVLVNGAYGIAVTNAEGQVTMHGEYTADGNVISCILYAPDATDLSSGKYYDITLSGDGLSANGGTCVMSNVKVTVTADFNGETVFGETSISEQMDKNVPFAIGNIPHETKILRGWYTDAACTEGNEVEFVNGALIPTADITIYAKWVDKVTVNLVGAGDKTTFSFGDGDVVMDYLNIFELDEVNEETRKYFAGWFVDAAFEHAVAEGATISVDDAGMTLYAKWVDVNVLYGEYSGKQLLSGSTYSGISVKVGIQGEMTVEVKGKTHKGEFVSYDADTQEVKWTPDADKAKTYTMWYDSASKMLVINEDLTESVIGRYPYVLMTEENAINAVEFIDYAASGTSHGGTKLILIKTGKVALVFGNKIYGNVALSNAAGDEVDYADIRSNKTIVVKDASANVVVAIGTSAVSFANAKDELGNSAVIKALDAHYGTYTCGNDSVVLDGIGNVHIGDKSGLYTLLREQDGAKVFEIYIRDRQEKITESEDDDGDIVTDTQITYTNVEYLVLTLGDTNTLEKPMARLTFVSSQTSVDPVDANINIPVELAKPDDTDTHVFRGWYTDGTYATAVPENYIPTADATIHAKWLERATLTVHYNDGVTESATINYAKGETVNLEVPKRESYKFMGWFTDEDLTTEWTETTISSDLTVYAKWIEAPIYCEKYGVMYISENNTSGTDSIDFRSGSTIQFKPDNSSESVSWPFNGNTTSVTSFDEASGTMLIDTESGQVGKGTHKAYIDKETYLIVLNAASGADSDFVKLFILIPNTFSSTGMNYSESYWNSGKTRAISFNWNSDLYTIFVHNNSVYFNVSLKNASGEDVIAKSAYKSETLYVRDAAGSVIAKFGYDGENMNELDGYEDITYTGANGNLTVNGVSTVTVGSSTGSYTLNKEEGAQYTADMYIDGSYYELTLDKSNSTYTLLKRMVNVTFVTAHDAGNAVSGEKNKNVEITLPVLTDADHVFRGWYIADETQLLSGAFTPTENVTLTAKWDVKVTLTVVYGNGLENVTLEYGSGDTAAPVEPAFKDGKAFSYWYTSDDNGATEKAQYTAGTITENTTIYCKWQDAVAQYGTYRGNELWGSTAAGGTNNVSEKALSVDPVGAVTGENSGNIADSYDSSTGLFKIYKNAEKTSYYLGYFDSENGVLVYTYGSCSAGKEYFGNDYYVHFLGATKVTSNGSYWNSGYNRLALFTITGGKWDTTGTDGLLVYIATAKDTDDIHVYLNVTISSSKTDLKANNAYSASDLQIRDAEGALIAEFVRDGSKGLVAPDGTQGVYTNGDDSFTLNGAGGIVWGDNSGTYKAAAEGSDYTYDVTLSNPKEYHRVTVTGNTFTSVKPEAVITFDVGGHGNNITVNQNLNITLDLRGTSSITDPVAEGYVFKGWFDGEGGTGSRVWDITPKTTESITVYAQWKASYTLTLVYNDGSQNGTDEYEEGTSVSLSDKTPASKIHDGKYFVGWYEDEALTQAVTSVTVSGNKTVYAKWGAPDSTAITVVASATNSDAEYGFTENNGVYRSSNQEQNSSKSRMTITANAAGKLMLSYQSSGESNYDYLYIKVGTSEKASAKGKTNTSGYTIGSDPKDDKWVDFEITLKEGDVVEIIFVKDNSSNSGADTGWVKDITFVRS